jgi:hypothetical protein
MLGAQYGTTLEWELSAALPVLLYETPAAAVVVRRQLTSHLLLLSLSMPPAHVLINSTRDSQSVKQSAAPVHMDTI